MARDPLAPGGSFYRGDVVNLLPRRPTFATDSAIPEFILKGWMPAEPFIGPDTNIVSFGSCFAAGIGRYLASLGFSVSTERQGSAYIQVIGDGMVNVYAICQQFEWAWEDRVPKVDLWHGWKAQEFGYDETIRMATKKLFDEADVFILTFGLSEIWYDEPTGEVFWRAVPEDKFDPSRHKFRVATHAETVERLRRIYDLIRQHRPNAAIVFTLSPISIMATFRPVSCVAANAVSKGRLRSAIDEVYEAVSPNDARFFYFPAYEVVMNGFRTPFRDDMRHPQVHVIEANMKSFERYFCKTSMPEEEYRAAIKSALDLDAVISTKQSEEIDAMLNDFIARWKASKPLPLAVDKVLLKKNRAMEREARLQEKQNRRDARASRLAGKSSVPLGVDVGPLEQDPAAPSDARLQERQARLDARASRLAAKAAKAAKRASK